MPDWCRASFVLHLPDSIRKPHCRFYSIGSARNNATSITASFAYDEKVFKSFALAVWLAQHLHRRGGFADKIG